MVRLFNCTICDQRRSTSMTPKFSILLRENPPKVLRFTLSIWRVIFSIHLWKGILLRTSEIPLNLNFKHVRMTNSDGRCLDLLPSQGSEEATGKKSNPVAGQIYKIIFKTREYFEHTNRKSFYPWVEVSTTFFTVSKSYSFSGSLYRSPSSLKTRKIIIISHY